MTSLFSTDLSGQVRELDADVLNAGFTELGRYRLTTDVPGALLAVDDEIISPVAAQPGSVWFWEPGFYAGEVRAELLTGAGDVLQSYRLDVSPTPGKLGAEEFSTILAELFDFDPRLVVGTEAAQTSIGTDGDFADPHLEYARLRRFAPFLVTALKVLAQKPLLRLRTERRRSRPQHVKRVDRESIQRALKEPSALYMIIGAESAPGRAELALFDVPLSYEHVDNPANRTMLATLQSVARRARQVSDSLQALADREAQSETRSALAPRVARRRLFLDKLSISLRRIARSEPFASVTRAETSAAGLNAISAHPAYARAYRYGWYILRPGISGDVRIEKLGISPTWEIYERWCFTKIVQALQLCRPELEWERTYPTSKDDCIRFRGSSETLRVDVWLQARCPAWDQPAFRQFASVSGERCPDILIAAEVGGVSSLVAIDAKYRTSRAGVLSGMQSAHLYKDCIRWKGCRPSMSLLLVPRAGGAAWLELPEFHTSHGVGVVQLGTESDLKLISTFLAGALGFEAIV